MLPLQALPPGARGFSSEGKGHSLEPCYSTSHREEQMGLRRRSFITLLGGAAVAWPLAARAQSDRVRRVGVLMGGDENDPAAKPVTSAFTQALADLGWIDGRNVRIDLRWHGDDNNRIRALAQELVGLHPDIILGITNLATIALQRETRTIQLSLRSG
jgi:putative ABC transport system substrate-binding protein